MDRLFGMMPGNEIKKYQKFRDQYGLPICIEAGPHGWTVIWADYGTNYKDVDADTEVNFLEAKKLIEDKGFKITPCELNERSEFSISNFSKSIKKNFSYKLMNEHYKYQAIFKLNPQDVNALTWDGTKFIAFELVRKGSYSEDHLNANRGIYFIDDVIARMQKENLIKIVSMDKIEDALDGYYIWVSAGDDSKLYKIDRTTSDVGKTFEYFQIIRSITKFEGEVISAVTLDNLAKMLIDPTKVFNLDPADIHFNKMGEMTNFSKVLKKNFSDALPIDLGADTGIEDLDDDLGANESAVISGLTSKVLDYIKSLNISDKAKDNLKVLCDAEFGGTKLTESNLLKWIEFLNNLGEEKLNSIKDSEFENCKDILSHFDESPYKIDETKFNWIKMFISAYLGAY